jgi:hypothetical protein
LDETTERAEALGLIKAGLVAGEEKLKRSSALDDTRKHLAGISATRHPMPYALYPIPYTLYPTPYTLHPTPYTLHLRPRARNRRPQACVCYLSPKPYTATC